VYAGSRGEVFAPVDVMFFLAPSLGLCNVFTAIVMSVDFVNLESIVTLRYGGSEQQAVLGSDCSLVL
jgi:hypothetical protein